MSNNQRSNGFNQPNASAEPDAKQIRQKYNLSQQEFAARLGISLGTLRNWEQGRRKPEGPARVLLQVASRNPEVIWQVTQQDQED